MIKISLRKGVYLLAIAGSMACTKNTLNLPLPAQTVAGVYKAQAGTTRLPIKGDTITMAIKDVAPDSVSVSLMGSINGQLVDSLSFSKAFIRQQIYSTGLNKRCVGYAIYLTAGQPTNQLYMTCQEENVFNYIYAPAGQSSGMLLKFKKV